MKFAVVIGLVAVVIGLRLWLRRRRGERAGATIATPSVPAVATAHRGADRSPLLGNIGLVAGREIRERVRGRFFRVATLIILLVVAAAIVIPTLHSGPARPQHVGVLGELPAGARAAVTDLGTALGTTVDLTDEQDRAAAARDLRAGRLDVVVVDGGHLLVDKPIDPADTSTTARLVHTLSAALGTLRAYEAAGLSASQRAALSQATPAPVESLQPAAQSTTRTTSLIGIILTFVMLTQYLTWILVGVMEEKASRVVEVLLAALRPLELLSGKVLGIGLVAMGQAALIVAFALVLAKGVGSSLLHGTAPVEVAAALFWLVLGYAFYCWVYAAAGSTAERQEQIQSLAFPLSLPILVGYIAGITTAASGNVSAFERVLAYLPPTAPFAMPVLVGLGAVRWWGFVASAAITLASTVAVARFAAVVYRRSILRTGSRVRLRDALAGRQG